MYVVKFTLQNKFLELRSLKIHKEEKNLQYIPCFVNFSKIEALKHFVG